MTNSTDQKFIRLALAVADIFSKDPSTRVGAVAVGIERNQVAFGYNGFPPGINDTPTRLNDRDLKLSLTLHAEENALMNASFRVRTLYVTRHPCKDCALRIIASRSVRQVLYLVDNEFEKRWLPSLKEAQMLLREAGIAITGVEL